MFSSVFSVYKVSLVVVVGSRALSDNADHNGHILMPRKSNSKLHSCIYESYCRDKPMSRMNKSNKILLVVKVSIFMYILNTPMFRWLLDHYFRPGWRVIMNPHHAIILSKKKRREHCRTTITSWRVPWWAKYRWITLFTNDGLCVSYNHFSIGVNHFICL